MYTVHEDSVAYKKLPGREHKVIIGPADFGGARHMCFGVAVFPGQSHAPSHVHPAEEEIIYVMSGKGIMYFDDQPEPLDPGTCVYVPPGVTHSIQTTSVQAMKLAYVFSPPAAPASYDRKSTT